MNRRRLSPLFPSCTLAAAALAAGMTGSLRAQFIETPEQKIIPGLTVKGEAELRKPADELRLSFGVVTENAEAARALADNNRIMESVMAAVEKAGLEEGEYETGRFDIRPRYSRRPRQPEPNWRPTIVDYEVTNTVEVRTTKMDLAGELIQAATTAGANSVDRVQFGLADRRRHRTEAIRTATRNALQDARVLAESADLTLVRMLWIELDHAAADSPRPFSRGRMAASAESSGAAPITPGDVTIRASVTVKYEIAPAE